MITPEQLKLFWKALDQGSAIRTAARAAGFSAQSGYNYVKQGKGRELVRPPSTSKYRDIAPALQSPTPLKKKAWNQRGGLDKDPRIAAGERDVADPIQHDDLSEEAARALEDFNFFSERYFGRSPTPWRQETAQRIFELFNDEHKHFVVVNAPPGCGKSTLFTHDIPAWLTVKNRRLRGVLGSWGMRPASTFTRQLRTTFERQALVPTSDDMIAKGLEREPGGVLAVDYGRFKPLGQSDFWTAEAFVVDQLDGRAVADKEPTWTAFGNGEILGWRVDLMIWDDLVTTKKLSSPTEQEKLHVWWDNEVEKRLEPGGLMVLQGQRLGPSDLYRYCLDKIDVDDIDELDGIDPDDPDNDAPRKYHHIVFRAHYDEKCADHDNEGTRFYGHSPRTAKPWPDGCLLDPLRLTYRDLRREEASNPSLYATVYQQRDTNPDTVLVPPHWISGDDDHPGCWDKDRGAWEVPDLEGKWTTVLTVDPSPTKSWAVHAYAYHPVADVMFLLDLRRARMTQPEFLYGDVKRGDYSGLAEEFRLRFRAIGIPLQHLIFEKNVAQRWFTQQPYVAGWLRKHAIRLHEHETTNNKSDPKYGITMLRPWFEFGKFRLPGKQHSNAQEAIDFTGRRNAIKLVNELTRYSLVHGPSGTDDQVMAAWMTIHRLPKLRVIDIDEMPRVGEALPQWLRKPPRRWFGAA